MKKLAVMFVCLALMCKGTCEAYYDEGNDGDSWETAYIIDSVEDFMLMRDRSDSGKYYKLNADIDLTSETDWDDLEFNGYFDGQNHTVRINSQNNYYYAGLFLNVGNRNAKTEIKNLNVTGNVRADCAGTLIHDLNSGTVENCSFNGTITFDTSESNYGAGGLVAHLEGGTVRDCTVNADISGGSYAGGIAGEMTGGTIENCTANVRLLNGTYRGGIVGTYSGGSANLSGNTWPSGYPQTGTDTPDTPEIAGAEWNGHIYRIYNENLTWEQAKAKCESLGGHLATITSQEEQNFIENMLRNSELEFYGYWLGAKLDDSGWWQWVTDEVFEKQYQNFASGQPDGAKYLQIFTPDEELAQNEFYTFGKWDDTTNDGTNAGPVAQHGFIFEKDIEQPEVKAAPLASDFQDWLAHPENWRNDGTESYGALPGPVDLSHLRNNPPRISGANASLVLAAADTLPVSFDARKEFGLPEARNQGAFNTCWAFASIGAMEASYKAQKLNSLGDSPDLSELHTAWFVYQESDRKNNVDPNECILDQMGTAQYAIAFLNQGIAPVNESEMNYSIAGSTSEGSDAKIEAFVNGRTAKDFERAAVSLSNTKDIGYVEDRISSMIKQNIMNNGAVYFQYHSDPSGYSNDYHTFYSEVSNPRTSHAALIIGWDDNYSRENFRNIPPRDGAWLVRNSRGSDFGDNGCFWMSYAQADTKAGMSAVHVFTVREESRDIVVNYDVISEDISESEDISADVIIISQHDTDGKTKNITPHWSAVIFRSKRDENLTRVAFDTTDNNAKYKIFVNNFGKNRPTDPGMAELPLMSGELPYAGHHTVDLLSPVELYKGDYYAVIIKLELDSGYEYPTGAEAAIQGYVNSSVNEGESFFAEGEPVPSVWQDGKYIDGGPYDACIKAFTEYRPITEFPPVITTVSLPDAISGQEYKFQFEASGSPVIEWRSGELPLGFTLSSQGLLSGYATEAGEYELVITAFNDVDTSEKTFTLKVTGSEYNPEPEPQPEPEPEPGPVPVPDSPRISSSGGGCNAGLSVICGAALLALFLKRR